MSVMSDATHQVKHPPTCTIHSLFTGGLIFMKSKMCPNEDMLYACMSSSLVGSSSSGSGGVERGRAMNRLQCWWNHVTC